jgi:hypothetical protein
MYDTEVMYSRKPQNENKQCLRQPVFPHNNANRYAVLLVVVVAVVVVVIVASEKGQKQNPQPAHIHQ